MIEENNDEIPKEIALQLQYNNSALATHIAIHVARVVALTHAPCHPCCCSWQHQMKPLNCKCETNCELAAES